jgi:photosystem II stability/assembly factor-like uncharacterized protein
MTRISSFLFLLFLLTACTAKSTSYSPAQSDEPTLAPYSPDTPSPPDVNAPLVESPAFVKIHFLNELDGWGVTETQVVRTNDGGLTWHNVTPPEVTETGYMVEMFVLDNNHVWFQEPDYANYPNSGFLYRTVDGGITWTKYSTPFSDGDVSFLDAGNGWMMAGLGVATGRMGVAIFQTSDGGATWVRKYINDPTASGAGDSLPLGGLKSGLVPLTMQTAWVPGVTYSIGTVYLYRTDDGGVTWSQVSLPLPTGAENFELSMDADQMKFVTATDGFLTIRMTRDMIQTAIYVTHDGGNTWELTPTLIPYSGPADFLSVAEAVIYNGSQFYITRDAARTWSIIPPDIVFGDTFAFMDFVNLNSGWVVTLDPTNRRTFYRTNDGGSTWFPVIP